jgi:putative colanic acid biosynthesis acetyltransferase WcaF
MAYHAEQPPRVTPEKGDAWPYPFGVYVRRATWCLCFFTIWKICPRRIYWLRAGILNLFGGRVSWAAAFSHNSWVEMPWDLTVGKHSIIGPRAVIYNLGGVIIGDRTVISQDVYICGGTHDYTDPNYPLIRKQVVIGSQVWVAAGAFICPGVTVGEGAVVGARSVVTKDVDPWTVVGGNPAKVLKKRVIARRLL